MCNIINFSFPMFGNNKKEAVVKDNFYINLCKCLFIHTLLYINFLQQPLNSMT